MHVTCCGVGAKSTWQHTVIISDAEIMMTRHKSGKFLSVSSLLTEWTGLTDVPEAD